jgi:hypothetical protein
LAWLLDVTIHTRQVLPSNRDGLLRLFFKMYRTLSSLQTGIDMSDDMLEDLMLSLDVDMSKDLTYKELLCGMKSWKKEKFDSKRKLVASGRGRSSEYGNETENLTVVGHRKILPSSKVGLII